MRVQPQTRAHTRCHRMRTRSEANKQQELNTIQQAKERIRARIKGEDDSKQDQQIQALVQQVQQQQEEMRRLQERIGSSSRFPISRSREEDQTSGAVWSSSHPEAVVSAQIAFESSQDPDPAIQAPIQMQTPVLNQDLTGKSGAAYPPLRPSDCSRY